MKLTNTIINDSSRVLNPDKKLTLILRNLQISDLDTLPDNYDAIDLCNNQLIEVSLINPCRQITTLLLNNNQELYHINHASFPHLSSLSLINCNIKPSHVLTWSFPHLNHLIVLDNPITTISNYRLLLIFLFPSLITLDFARVTQKERVEAQEFFGSNDLLEFIKSQTGNNTTTGTTTSGTTTTTSREQLINRLKNSTDLDEIERIEKLLNT